MPQCPKSHIPNTCSQEAWLLLQPQNADAASADAAPTGAAAATEASRLRQRPPLKSAETPRGARKRSRPQTDNPPAINPAPGAHRPSNQNPGPSAIGSPCLVPAPGAHIPRAAPPELPGVHTPASAEEAAAVKSLDGRDRSRGAAALCAGSVVWAAMGLTAWPALVTRACHEVSLHESEKSTVQRPRARVVVMSRVDRMPLRQS